MLSKENIGAIVSRIKGFGINVLERGISISTQWRGETVKVSFIPTSSGVNVFARKAVKYDPETPFEERPMGELLPECSSDMLALTADLFFNTVPTAAPQKTADPNFVMYKPVKASTDVIDIVSSVDDEKIPY